MELPLFAKWMRLTTLDQGRGSALTFDDGYGLDRIPCRRLRPTMPW